MKNCTKNLNFSLPSPGKINLFLRILNRRPDGYHQIQTLFQLIDYGDELTISAHPEIEFTCNIPELKNDDNLVLKAAYLLHKETQTNQGALIHLNKKLPIGGGVGGGSSNAASALIGLNQLWQLNLSIKELTQLSLQLGADVPFFVNGVSAFAEGIGEQLHNIDLPKSWHLVLSPPCHVNTKQMYQHKNLTRGSMPIKVSSLVRWIDLKNDFEDLARQLYSEIDDALNLLQNVEHFSLGKSRLTGSGGCVFSSFSSYEKASKAQAIIGNAIPSFITKSIAISPLKTTSSRINQLLTV